MASRKRPVMPSVAQFQQPPSVKSRGAYDEHVLGISRAGSSSGSSVAKDYASGNQSAEMAAAMAALKDGDDSVLMPYQPTPSINPPRPRTLAAGYDMGTQTLFVKFRDGAIYAYEGVPPRVWRNYRRVKSPGRAINRTLNNYPYHRLDVDG